MRHLLIVLIATVASGCVGLGGDRQPGDGGWRLVFAVSAEGRTLAGDKGELMRAVRAGLPVRVGWGMRWTGPDGMPGGIEHVVDAGFVSLYKGEVFAQVPAFLRQRPDPATAEVVIADDGASFVATLDTAGRIRHVFRPAGQSQTERVATYWYVPWRNERGPAAVDVPDRLH